MSQISQPLIIRADDAGSASGANHGIQRALLSGAITAVGFMAVGPAFADAAALLRGNLANVDVGVHATLNAEWDQVRWGPLTATSRVPSLLGQDGCFLPHPRDLRDRFKVSEMVTEVRAQIRAVQASGLSPCYLDTHMRFDLLPGAADALARLAAEENLVYTAARPPCVPTNPSGHADGAAAAWLSAIRGLPSGLHQLVTHPGSDTPDMHRFHHAGLNPGQVARERAGETDALCSREFLAGLHETGIHLARFSRSL